MKKVLAAAGGLLCVHSAGVLAQPLCASHVQISPTLYNYPTALSGESEILEPTGTSYSISAAAADPAGYSIADIIKLKSDGARDLSFGGFGSVVPAPPAASSQDAALTRDGSGNLIIANMAADGASVVLNRYSAAGKLDTTYGTAGIATIPVIQVTGPWALEAAPDGSVLVVAGGFPDPSSSGWQPVIFKVTPAGALDTSFGIGGFSYFYTGAFGPNGKATDLSLRSDGSILVGGRVGNNANFFVARLFANGTLDTSFGTSGGITAVSFGTTLAEGRKMAVQADGKIVLVGAVGPIDNTPNGANTDTGVIRLTANGALDPTFNGTGSLHLPGFHGWQVALQGDNRILISATRANGPQATQALAVRLTASGRLDSTFGHEHNGVVPLAVPGVASEAVAHIAYEPASGIHELVIGTDLTGTTYTEYLVRLNADGEGSCR